MISINIVAYVGSRQRQRLLKRKKHRLPRTTLHAGGQDEFLLHEIVGHRQMAD